MIQSSGCRFLLSTFIIAAVHAELRAQTAICPANSLFSQAPDDSCFGGTSEAGTPFRRWERFSGVAGPMTGLRWFGFAARPQGSTFVACEESDHSFEITIARDVAGAPGSVECTYTLVATRTPTSLACGDDDDALVRYQYEVALPAPCVLVRGWVSIVGMGDPSCWFLWYRSAIGDGASRCEGCANLIEGVDLSLCVLGTPGGVTGACCNEVTAACANDVSMANCAADDQRFTPNATCETLSPPCGQLTGPCCRSDAPCRLQVEMTCIGQGGQWLGPDAECDDCPALGACCQGATHCIIIEQAPCLSEGHSWIGPNTTCAECPSLPECPPTAVLVSQPPSDPIAGPTAFTSEAASAFRLSENFSNVTGPVTALTWWGLDMRRVGNGFVECTETDNTFQVTFRADAAGAPGNEICSHQVLASRTPTGLTYNGAQLNEYHAELPSPCALTRGWVTLVGQGDEQCWFLWMSSPVGDNLSHCSGCSVPTLSANLAICLHGTPGGVFGACCNDALTTCSDNIEMDDCAANHQRFSPNQPCAALDPACGTVLGACCFAQFGCGVATEAGCAAQAGLWLGANSQCASCPCIVDCPVGARPESEPPCDTGYIDQYNAGCTAAPHQFTPIAIGDAICGVAGFYSTGVNYLPDQDWYEIQVPAGIGLNVRITAELPVRMEIRESGEGCPGNSVAFVQASLVCQTVYADAFSEAPTTYWIAVSAYVPNDASACGKRYTLEILSPHGCIPGDVNQDAVVNGADVQTFVECVVTGSSPFNCLCGDMNFDGQTNAADVSPFVTRLMQP